MNLDTFAHLLLTAAMRVSGEGYGDVPVRDVEVGYREMRGTEQAEVCAVVVHLHPKGQELARSFGIMQPGLSSEERQFLAKNMGLLVTEMVHVPPYDRGEGREEA